MRSSVSGSLLLCVLLVASACGDDSSSDDTEVPLADLPAEIATVFCSALEDCFGELLDVFPAQDCEENLEKQYRNEEFAALEQAVDAGTVRYDAKEAPECLRALQKLGCDIATQRSPAACESALQGTVLLGGSCSVNAECEGDAFCDLSAGTCPGVCAELRQEGENCDSDSACSNGLSCAGTCERAATAGQSCGGAQGADCRVGLVCRGSTDTESGTCANADAVLSQELGEPCHPGETRLCKAGLSCAYTGRASSEQTFACAEKVGHGADCTLGFPDPCPDGEFCDVDPLGDLTDGTCVALPGAGQPCLVGEFRTSACASSLSCINEVCTAVKANGAACRTEAECYGGRCVASTCQGSAFCTD